MARSPHIELESMSDGQVRELIENAREVLSDRFSSRVDELRALAREAGYEITVTKAGESGPRRRRRSESSADADDRRGQVLPKYRNPDSPHQTWSGRGRDPKWFTQQVSKGTKREDMLIAQGPPNEPAPAPQEAHC